jgi:crotonobetainyl-CoA:carnitine CoA-transferase CaiB-like acyl-CoA transferase
MKVVDLSCDVAGRFAAKLFALGGSEVIRPAAAAPEDDLLAAYLDSLKTAVRVDGPNAAAEMLAGADVIFLSFDGGRRLGLAGELLPLAPTDCVRVTTSTYGTTGPYAAWRGGPAAAWAAGGYLAITGDPEREPLMGPLELCRYVNGYAAAIAAEAGLAARRRTGRGCDVDVSAMETMLGLHQSTFSRLAMGAVRVRTGRFAEVYPLAYFRCADGYISLGTSTNDEFDRLCIVAGRPELAADERFANGFARLANADALDAALTPFLRRQRVDELVELLQENGVAAVKVTDPADMLRHPQLEHRHYLASSAGGAAMPGDPLPHAKVHAAGAGRRPADARTWPLEPRSGAPLPLEGVRVLDFTAWWAGPSATRTLADLGADVIWVERPKSRLTWSEAGDPNGITYELYDWKMFRHKRSVAVDLSDPALLEAVRRLADQADVLIENFRPGVADRLGVGARELCARNPGLAYVSLSGFGADGPWSRWRSYGPNIEAASSVAARTGYRDGEPLRLGHALPDGIGGLAGALTALRALREREARGCGASYDLSQLEAYVAMSGEEILAAGLDADWPRRIGNRARDRAVQGVFPCAGQDQWIAIRLADAQDVARFAAATGVTVRPDDLDAAEAAIGGYTAGHDKRQLAAQLQAAGIEAFPALTPPELIADPHLRERGFFAQVRITAGTFPMPGHPYRSEPRLADCGGVVPRLGEHNHLVATELV